MEKTKHSSWLHPKRQLEVENLRPKRSLSQNFLTSEATSRRIVKALEVQRGDHVVEIGPGTGSLTRLLLEHPVEITAVERDASLAKLLRTDLASSRLRVVEGDAAVFSYADAALSAARLRVIGNLPYGSTGAILRGVMRDAAFVRRAVFMVQAEVCDRILAPVGCKAYGALTVFCQAAFKTKKVFDVPPGAFYPRPQVVSSVLTLEPYPVARAPETEEFQEVVGTAFRFRRKTLRRALAYLPEPHLVAELLTTSKIDGQRRAETLSVEEFAELGTTLATVRKRSTEKPKKAADGGKSRGCIPSQVR